MITEHDWLTTNTRERTEDEPFVAQARRYAYPILSVADSIQRSVVALKAIGKPVYVGLSGGKDSCRAVESCVEGGLIPIPVIVVVDGNEANEKETRRAFSLCERLDMTPRVVHLTEQEHFDIFLKVGGVGVWAVPQTVVAEIATKESGIYLNCDHFICTNHGRIELGFNEYDFYSELIDDCLTFPLYNHSLATVYAMLKALPDGYEDMDESRLKRDIFGGELLPKIGGAYTSPVVDMAYTITKRLRGVRPRYCFPLDELAAFAR